MVNWMKTLKWITRCLECLIPLLIILGIVGMVDSKSSALPAALGERLREISHAIPVYYITYGQLPETLEDLKEIDYNMAGAEDPYSPDSSLFGYEVIRDSTSEHCMIYTARLSAPAIVFAGTTTTPECTYVYTPEFESLRPVLHLESRNKRLRLGASPPEYVLFILQNLFRPSNLASLFKDSES